MKRYAIEEKVYILFDFFSPAQASSASLGREDGEEEEAGLSPMDAVPSRLDSTLRNYLDLLERNWGPAGISLGERRRTNSLK